MNTVIRTTLLATSYLLTFSLKAADTATAMVTTDTSMMLASQVAAAAAAHASSLATMPMSTSSSSNNSATYASTAFATLPVLESYQACSPLPPLPDNPTTSSSSSSYGPITTPPSPRPEPYKPIATKRRRDRQSKVQAVLAAQQPTAAEIEAQMSTVTTSPAVNGSDDRLIALETTFNNLQAHTATVMLDLNNSNKVILDRVAELHITQNTLASNVNIAINKINNKVETANSTTRRELTEQRQEMQNIQAKLEALGAQALARTAKELETLTQRCGNLEKEKAVLAQACLSLTNEALQQKVAIAAIIQQLPKATPAATSSSSSAAGMSPLVLGGSPSTASTTSTSSSSSSVVDMTAIFREQLAEEKRKREAQGEQLKEQQARIDRLNQNLIDALKIITRQGSTLESIQGWVNNNNQLPAATVTDAELGLTAAQAGNPPDSMS